MKIWECKIGEIEDLPLGADFPMRAAIEAAYKELTGRPPDFIFSGWGAELTEPERAVVENRLPSAEHEAEWPAGTPRTDQHVATAYVVWRDAGEWVKADFCRELERENAALSAQVVELTISRDDKYQRLKDVTEQWQKDVARAEAAEVQVVELQKALKAIAEGDFDDLEPDDGLHTKSARAVARGALK